MFQAKNYKICGLFSLAVLMPEFHSAFRSLFELSSKFKSNPLLALYKKMEEVIISRQQSNVSVLVLSIEGGGGRKD